MVFGKIKGKTESASDNLANTSQLVMEITKSTEQIALATEVSCLFQSMNILPWEVPGHKLPHGQVHLSRVPEAAGSAFYG